MSGIIPSLRVSSPGELRVNRKEALRYLGYGKNVPDDSVLELMDACEAELLAAAQGRACWVRVPVIVPSTFCVDLGFGPIESVSLAKHLAGCHSALLFAATIGIGPDRLIAKWSRLRPSRSAVLDALGSSAIESWCDLVELELTRDEEKHCDRFSPGYGDFALHHQKDFMQCLDMGRTLGITLSDSLLMTPTKSVTAVIGLGASARTCGNKCMFCTKENCIYREVIV
ncbi:MAG: hypothetical protein IKJ34_02280 [Mailhella sp.]|nr:hypothetical protein [Mailhella sp.]